MIGLTRTQWETLYFLHQFAAKNGYSPTYQQIADGVGYASKASVYRVLGRLEDRGYLTRCRQQACSVALTDEGTRVAAAFAERLHARSYETSADARSPA